MIARPSRLAAALVALGSLLGLPALASPAQELFDQATYYLAFHYHGYSKADYRNFGSRFQPELDAACAGKKESCPYSAALALVARMVSELNDGHSYLLSKSERSEIGRSRDGQGPPAPRIGIQTEEVGGSSDRVVVDVVEAGPADRAGIRRGDRLVALDGKPSSAYTATSKTGLQEAIAAAIGSGKTVRLGIRRGDRRLEFSLKGERPATSRLPALRVLPGASGVGVLRVPDFGAYREVSARVHDLVRSAQARGLRGLVVDLRDNPGGLDLETLAAVGAFVSRTGFSEQTRTGTVTKHWRDGRVVVEERGTSLDALDLPAALWRGPLVVLVNAHSYSGAEYFAQLLQDAGRALVVGEATGGLGNTVTSEYGLADGSAIEITLGRSLRLNGSPLPERVKPDVVVKDDLETLARTGRDLPLERAVAELRKAR